MTPAPHGLASLARSPNSLAPHYSRFVVAERLLLTGHSHQAWPDVALDGQLEAWTDAATHVDEKWGRAAEKAGRVRRGFARLLGDDPANIVLGASTHELVVRFLSALPLEHRPRLVTTDGEFHTLRRQLDRLSETGRIEVVKVAASPAETLAERLALALDDRTAALFVSSVLFLSGRIVPGLDRVASACRKHGAELLVDAYHHLNVVPFALASLGLEDVFAVGGGYKYVQLGEGNCFLRVPPGRDQLFPVITGWFSEFAALTERPAGRVPYGEGAARWAGSTYDPTSHYRAASVFDFFAAQNLTVDLLREVSRHQVGRLAERFDALDLDPRVLSRDRSAPLEAFGGFLAVTGPRAGDLSGALKSRGVGTDFRGTTLRLGPAPYLCDDQLDRAIDLLGLVVRELPDAR
ncbi:MAG: kynureninase [Candidatus Eisenbacteria bacterium]